VLSSTDYGHLRLRILVWIPFIPHRVYYFGVKYRSALVMPIKTRSQKMNMMNARCKLVSPMSILDKRERCIGSYLKVSYYISFKPSDLHRSVSVALVSDGGVEGAHWGLLHEDIDSMYIKLCGDNRGFSSIVLLHTIVVIVVVRSFIIRGRS
jgi:hypothetical protein